MARHTTGCSTVLLVGNGCRGCEEKVREFAKHFDKVYTTWRSLDIIPEATRVGLKSPHKFTDENILVLGCRLHIGQVGYNGEFTTGKVTVVDIDRDELDKLPEEYDKICANVKDYIWKISLNESVKSRFHLTL